MKILPQTNTNLSKNRKTSDKKFVRFVVEILHNYKKVFSYYKH
jgi:hypothetical protein